MITPVPRVAFFPDTYHQIDGVANTSRQFEAFAIRNRLPFLTVFGGDENVMESDGTATRMSCRRGPIGFQLDSKHTFDLAFWRHCKSVEQVVRNFNPDILHITGPSDVGQLGPLIAHRLRIPLAASWHTNIHEYAEQRTVAMLPWLPSNFLKMLGPGIRQASLHATLRFYKIARMLFAPNPELIELLEKGTGKPCYPMPRGVDTALFSPQRRDRSDHMFVLGYVGRLTAEKNIRFLAELEQALQQAGNLNFRFLIVGQGAEAAWLKAKMWRADFPGVLRGEALARAYANMDAFVFPSRTDTYGNVVLEALASGVPAIVTNSGGPRFIVRPGETGFVANNLPEFVQHIQTLAGHPDKLDRMRAAARAHALTASWDNVFKSVYSRYSQCLRDCAEQNYVRAGNGGLRRRSSAGSPTI